MSASAELWQRRITHEEYVVHGDDWKRVGEGHCATCGREGNLFLRPIDNPGMLSCANCRDSIRRAYKRLTNADEPPRSQDEIEEKKFEQLLNEPPRLLARPDPGDVCACGDRRIEHEKLGNGPCRLNGLGHAGAPPCNAFRLNEADRVLQYCWQCGNPRDARVHQAAGDLMGDAHFFRSGP